MSNTKKYPEISFSLKPTLLFFSALAMNLILHELSHAITAYLLHIKSTMYQLFVNPDIEHASRIQNIFIAVSGPFFSLFLGFLSWLFYKTYSDSTIKLFSVYSAVFGISIFLGNLFATSLGGDFHTAASIANVPN